jgi:hypothetical protein
VLDPHHAAGEDHHEQRSDEDDAEKQEDEDSSFPPAPVKISASNAASTKGGPIQRWSVRLVRCTLLAITGSLSHSAGSGNGYSSAHLLAGW